MTAVNVRVGLRVRPMSDGEKENSSRLLDIQADAPNKQIKIAASMNEKVFSFDHVFDNLACQSSIYEEAVAPLLHKILDGWNGCVLAYGQTGSGKTYTMGTGQLELEEERWGIAPRLMNEVFNRIKEKDADDEVKVTVSFLEIYNEDVYDLLSDQSRSLIAIRENASGIQLPNLRQVEVGSFEEAMSLLRKGVDARTTSSTAMNLLSSRSHAIFSMELQRRTRDVEFTSKLRVVDLAGSEAVHKTSVQSTTFREGININKSLLALANMIEALNQDKAYIPYRDSILTRLLQESLGGNCSTVLIACVCPTLINSTETHTTMRFAERIRGIKTKPTTVFSCYGSARKRPMAPTPAKLDSHKGSKKFQGLFTSKLQAPAFDDQMGMQLASRRRSARLFASLSEAETQRPCETLLPASSEDTLTFSPAAECSQQKMLSEGQQNVFSVTPLVQRVAQRVEEQVTAQLDKIVSRMEERFRECVEESFSSHAAFANPNSPAMTDVTNSTFRQEDSFFKVPSSITVRERQQSLLCPPTPQIFKRPRCSILPVTEKENFCNCSSFYDDPMKSYLSQTQPHYQRRLSTVLPSVAQIMPSPQRGWKIQIDPQVLERSNHNVLGILNNGSKADIQALPCIGPKTAQLINNWREIHGTFQNIEDVRQVNGIAKSFYKRFVKANMLSHFEVE